jgi:hypothetical protein
MILSVLAIAPVMLIRRKKGDLARVNKLLLPPRPRSQRLAHPILLI